MNRTTKSVSKKNKERKNIEVILREMIEECQKVGRLPKEIRLTQEDYDELVKRNDLYYPAGYEVMPVGVVYHPKPIPKKIREYMGLPVYLDDQTKILWL